jgi:hypothetical protein
LQGWGWEMMENVWVTQSQKKWYFFNDFEGCMGNFPDI